MGFFRGLMVPICFLLYLGIFAAAALAAVAAGAVASGLSPDELQTLIPSGAGPPSPWAIAGGAALVADLFIAMIALFIAERVHTVGRFIGASLKTSLWFAVPLAAGLALYLSGQPGDGLEKFLPALALALALPLAAFASGVVLGLPFLWWVSERPPVRRARRVPPPPPPPPAPPPHDLPPEEPRQEPATPAATV